MEHFIRYDEYQNKNLDQKLPLGVEKLQTIFCKDELDREFTTLSDLGEKATADQIRRKEEIENEFYDVEATAEEFERKQYTFVIPSFPQQSVHRSVSDSIILPFIKDVQIGGGSYGTAFRVDLPGPTYVQKISVRLTPWSH